MALSRNQSRLFVLILVLVMVGLATLAAILISRGMNDEELQEHIQQMEETER
ncbi:MAG: hypothetical protein R3284_04875 [Rubricoccaceae bacterium]|nr:hypothetical protein [Rubricoccaceae bacterium]